MGISLICGRKQNNGEKQTNKINGMHVFFSLPNHTLQGSSRLQALAATDDAWIMSVIVRTVLWPLASRLSRLLCYSLVRGCIIKMPCPCLQTNQECAIASNCIAMNKEQMKRVGGDGGLVVAMHPPLRSWQVFWPYCTGLITRVPLSRHQALPHHAWILIISTIYLTNNI